MNGDGISRATLADFGLLVIRLMIATVLLFHGSQKLFGEHGIEGFAGALEKMNVPLPTLSAWMAALAEFGGGLFLALGSGMRIAIIPAIITMLVAIVKVHPGAFSAQHNGMEYPLTLMMVMIGLLLTGPGRLTVGTLLGKRA